ncbi:MAG: hypothetical protein HY361_00235 [Candidatus Aenigmarchaeota archaeon]|nr:hypothetical protein [Candidatus Aenigmarchaeota archaeon]
MKGLVFTITLMFFAITLLTFTFLYKQSLSEFNGQIIKNSLIDRVYYKYQSIQNDLRRLLGGTVNVGGVNVTVEENNNLTVVNFTEVLPRRPGTSDFSKDLDNYEKFAEAKLNETNLLIDLNVIDLKCLPFIIEPYNIRIIHIPDTDCTHASAQTEVIINASSSWQYLKNYTFIFRPDGNIAGADITGWSGGGCNKPGLGLNIIFIGKDTIRGPFSTTTSYDKICKFNMDEIACPGASNKGYVHVVHNQNSQDADKGIIDIQVHPNCNITSTVSLNLTDIPGTTSVSLPTQIIKIKETLYEIEKNDTIYINK